MHTHKYYTKQVIKYAFYINITNSALKYLKSKTACVIFPFFKIRIRINTSEMNGRWIIQFMLIQKSMSKEQNQ